MNLCKTTIIHPHTHPPSYTLWHVASRCPASVNQHLLCHTRKLSSSAATVKHCNFQTATICPSWVSTTFQHIPHTTERKMCVTVSSEGRFMSQPPISGSCCLCVDRKTDSHWCSQTHLCVRATVSCTQIYSIHPSLYLSIVSVSWVLLADDALYWIHHVRVSVFAWNTQKVQKPTPTVETRVRWWRIVQLTCVTK